jgi:hypothetical protein
VPYAAAFNFRSKRRFLTGAIELTVSYTKIMTAMMMMQRDQEMIVGMERSAVERTWSIVSKTDPNKPDILRNHLLIIIERQSPPKSSSLARIQPIPWSGSVTLRSTSTYPDKQASQSLGYSSRTLLTKTCAFPSQRLKWRPASRMIASEGSASGAIGSMFSSAT